MIKGEEELTTQYLKANIDDVKDDIRSVCERLSMDASEVTLIGVTKTYEPEIINASIDYGITDIAENKVQEILRKFDEVKKGVRWHLIGHLQTNKVKYIIDKVDLIHSVDSVRLAEEIHKRAKQIGKIQDILIQINIADEEQKFGIKPSELDGLLEGISSLDHVRVCGLMNIAPFVDDPETLRGDFKQMHDLFNRLQHCAYANVNAKFLSMGMSGDYPVALEEGANMIRIGTKLYGQRQYNK